LAPQLGKSLTPEEIYDLEVAALAPPRPDLTQQAEEDTEADQEISEEEKLTDEELFALLESLPPSEITDAEINARLRAAAEAEEAAQAEEEAALDAEAEADAERAAAEAEAEARTAAQYTAGAAPPNVAMERALTTALSGAERQRAFEQAEAEREARKEADLERLANIARAERELERAGQEESLPVRPLEEVLDELGVPKNAKVRTDFPGATTDNAGALQALREYAGRTKSPQVRAKVLDFLRGTEPAPSEPTATVSEPVGEPAGVVEGVEPAGAGVSPADGEPELGVGRGRGVSDLGAGPEGVTAVAQAPDTGAVVGDGVPAAEPVARTGVQPTALEDQGELFPEADLGTAPARTAPTEAPMAAGPSPQQQLITTTGEAIAPTPAVEAETPTAPAVEAEVTTPVVEAEAEAETEAKTEAPTTPKTAPLSAGAAADITSKLDAVKSKSARSQTPEEKAVLAYLNGYNGDPDAALEALGFDLAVREGITQRRKGDDSDVDLAYKVYKELGQGRFDRLPAGTGGTVTGRGAATKQAPADLALKWLRENGDASTNTKIDAAIDAALGAVEKQIRYRTAPGGRRRKTVPVLPRLQAAARTGRSRASIISELVTELDSPTMNPKRVEKLAKLLPKEGAIALINRAIEGNRVQGRNVGFVTNILEKQQRRPDEVAEDLAAVQIEERLTTLPEDSALLDAMRQLAEEVKKTTPNAERVKELTNRINKVEALRVALQSPLPDAAVEALGANDLSTAIDSIATEGEPGRFRRTARLLLNFLGDTQVEVVDGLVDAEGNRIAGGYDTENNVILLDSISGMNPHTLLHELSHAAQNKAIAEGKLPAVKRLQKIYDELYPSLGGVYGATNLSEFIAEYNSNPDFVMQVASLSSAGRVNAVRRIMNELMNIVRVVLGRDTKSSLEMNTPIDQLIAQIMEPAYITTEPFVTLFGNDAKVQGKYLERALAQYFNDAGMLNRAFAGMKDPLSPIINAMNSIESVLPLRGVLGFAHAQSIGDILGHFRITGAKDFYPAIERVNGGVINAIKRVEVQLDQQLNWRKAHPDRVESFDRVVMLATLEQVDPTKPRKTYEDDAEKLAVYDRMQTYWERMGESGREQWKRLRKFYQDQFSSLKDVLMSNIDEYVEDAETARSLKQDIFAKLFDEAALEVYFPLARQGNHWLTYDIEVNGQMQRVVEAFETRAQRNRVSKDLEDQGIITRRHAAPQSQMYANAPDGSFMRGALNILEQGNVSADVKSQIMDLFVSALPETALIRAMKRRENRLGALQDSMTAMRMKGFGLAREVARLKYGNELRAVQNNIVGDIKERQEVLTKLQQQYESADRIARSNPTDANIKRRDGLREQLSTVIARYGSAKMSNAMAEALEGEVRDRVNGTLAPPSDIYNRIAAFGNKLAFVDFMGANASSAIIQAAQTPIINMPATAARTDAATATKMYSTALGVWGSSGFAHEVPIFDSNGVQVGTDKRYAAHPSIDNYYIENAAGVLRVRPEVVLKGSNETFFEYTDPEGNKRPMTKAQFFELLRPLVQALSDRGTLGKSMLLEQAGLTGTYRAPGAAVGMLDRAKNAADLVVSLSGAGFHMAETGTRQISFVANYLNELERLNTRPTEAERDLTPEERQQVAVDQAIYITTQTNGPAGVAAGPRYSQGSKGIAGAVARNMMMFHNYGFAMWYHQLKMVRESLNRVEDPELRSAARKALLGTMAMVVGMTGLQGFPLTGAVLSAIDGLGLLEDDETPAGLQAERYFGPEIWNGTFNWFTKTVLGGELDVAQRTGLSGLVFQNSRYVGRGREELALKLEDISPFGSSVARRIKAIDDYRDGRYDRFIEQMAPLAIGNYYKGTRYAEEGDLTRAGVPILGAYTDAELLGRKTGFMPSRRARVQYGIGVEKKKEIDRDAEAARLRKLRNEARYAGDYQRVNEIDALIFEFGEANPRHIISNESVRESWKRFKAEAERARKTGGVSLSDENSAAAEAIVEAESLKNQQQNK